MVRYHLEHAPTPTPKEEEPTMSNYRFYRTIGFGRSRAAYLAMWDLPILRNF